MISCHQITDLVSSGSLNIDLSRTFFLFFFFFSLKEPIHLNSSKVKEDLFVYPYRQFLIFGFEGEK